MTKPGKARTLAEPVLSNHPVQEQREPLGVGALLRHGQAAAQGSVAPQRPWAETQVERYLPQVEVLVVYRRAQAARQTPVWGRAA